MNQALRCSPKPPIGSFILIALMYLSLFLCLLRPRSSPHEGPGIEIPSFTIFVLLCALGYLISAVALSIRLYARRKVSRAYSIAFYASLGILALFTALIWTV